jgi:tellurite methyltransferase
VKDWDTKYRTTPSPNNEPSGFLVETVRILQPGLALDLACGAGRNMIHLAKLGWHVTGVDSSSEGLKIARARADALNLDIELIQNDLEAAPLQVDQQSLDLIIDFFYLHRPLWPLIRSGLKINGRFVAEIHLQDSTPGVKPMNPDFLLAPGELLSEFKDWKIEHYAEGTFSGLLSRRTAQIIARRVES